LQEKNIVPNSDARTTYEDYYARPIEERLQTDDSTGFKLVVGPTGLGKTFAIPLVIHSQRQQGRKTRYIYTSHRHMLIQEMEEALRNHPLLDTAIPSVYLKSNTDIVTDFVNYSGLQTFLDYLDSQFKFFEPTGKTVNDVTELVNNIINVRCDIEKGNLSQVSLKRTIKDLSHYSSEFIKLFETGLKEIDDTRHSILMQDRQIWRLFPYIRFLKDENRPVLLATVQKLLHGFFDGRRRQTITSLSNNVIFLDEFEVQEGVILQFMCAHDGIRNNFEFVRLFHDEVVIQQRLGNLTPDSTPVKIINQLQTELSRNGYDYPPIFRFTMDENEFYRKKTKGQKEEPQTITVFQSRRIVQNNPFFFVNEGDAWRIAKPGTPQSITSRQMLYTVSRITDEVLEFFAEMWTKGLEVEWQEWIDHCYNERNDTINGEYHKIIGQYGAFKRPLRLLKMRNTGAIRNSIYYKGFSLHKLTRGKYQNISPDEVQIQQKTLQITPEYILWQLCQSNLVFSISATGDIPRYINAFDLRWLEQNTPYIPITSQDTELIHKMKQEKALERAIEGQSYNIRLEFAKFLPETHKALTRFLENRLEAEGFFTKNPTESQDSKDARRNLVNRFLETTRWVVSESNNQAHLVFVNSFAYIKKLLDKKQELYETGRDDLTQHFIVQQGRHEQEYRLTVDGKPCYLVLLNAQKAKEDDPDPFECDTIDGKLIVVTQYESAALGVNLEWRNPHIPNTEAHDFQGIHLLEAKHFYFTTQKTDDDDSNLDIEKMFIWQVWKLKEGRMISQRQFQESLKFNQHQITSFNSSVYKQTLDYVLNQVALFHQAFGRVDRKWQPTDTIDVRLADSSSANNTDDGVFWLLARYLNEDDEIEKQRIARDVYTSNLILRIHDEVAKLSNRQLRHNQRLRQDISALQDCCRQRIQALLDLIDQMKKGTFADNKDRQIKELWLNVREAMLSQDYLFQDDSLSVPVDFKQDFVFSASYLQMDDKLYVDNLAHPTITFRDSSLNTQELNLNWPYRRFAENEVISRYFLSRGYELHYRQTTPNYVFAPHAIQAILAGAVGEAALEALLRFAKIRIDNPIWHPTPLFELFDIKITDKPIYLDAKSFSQATIYRMNVQPDDPDYNPKLNGPSLLYNAQKKWHEITNHTGETNTKFVIINLQHYRNGLNEYWDENLQPVNTFEDSAITLIQGAIDPTIQDPNNPAQLQPSFSTWLNQIQNF
jgi:hypothetical protein